MAADVLDQSNVSDVAAQASSRYSQGQGAGSGACTTTRTSTATRPRACTNVLQTVPGEVWLTETGGIATFRLAASRRRPRAPRRATKYMFQLADRFDAKQAGLQVASSRGSTSTAGSASRTAHASTPAW